MPIGYWYCPRFRLNLVLQSVQRNKRTPSAASLDSGPYRQVLKEKCLDILLSDHTSYGQLNSLMKSVKSERVPSLKKYTALPLLLSADRDEDLVRLLDYFV